MIDQDTLNNHSLQLRRVVELDTKIDALQEQMDALENQLAAIRRQRVEANDFLVAAINSVSEQLHDGIDVAAAKRAYSKFRFD